MTTSNGRRLVRCAPPIQTTYWCRECSSTETVSEGSESCYDCGATNTDEGPVAQSGSGPELPFRNRGAGPRGCCSCGAIWVAQTSHVIWFFEGNLQGAVCPTCARADADTRVWQQFCDISDAIDTLMQAAQPTDRAMFTALLQDRAAWFGEWRDDPTAAIDAAP